MSSRDLEAKSVTQPVPWSQMLLATIGAGTLRNYIDGQINLVNASVASLNTAIAAVNSVLPNKLNRVGDTANGLSSNAWFTSINNTGWRTSYGGGFNQTAAGTLDVIGGVLLNSPNGIRSTVFDALVGTSGTSYRFSSGLSFSEFYRAVNGDTGLNDSVHGLVWKLVQLTGEFELLKRLKLNPATITGTGPYLSVDANGYLVRVADVTPAPVGSPPVSSPVGSPPVGTPPVGTPPVGTPPVGTPPVGSPVG